MVYLADILYEALMGLCFLELSHWKQEILQCITNAPEGPWHLEADHL